MKLFLQLTFKQLHYFLTNNQHRKFISLALRYGNKARFEPARISINGFQFHVPDCLSFIWQYKDIFADKSYAFAAPDKPTILDCGANIGSSVAFFKTEYPKADVIAYEADPSIFTYLNENVTANKITAQLHNKAVWIHNKGIEIASEGADGGGIHAQGTKVQVESVDLAEELRRFAKVDLLKMDIEGAESAVVPHCENELHRVQNLFIEYHAYVGQEQNLGEILQVLSRQGFRYFIRPEADRPMPFINRQNKSNLQMDVQLNIFAYRM